MFIDSRRIFFNQLRRSEIRFDDYVAPTALRINFDFDSINIALLTERVPTAFDVETIEMLANSNFHWTPR